MTITDAATRGLAQLIEQNCPAAERVDVGISDEVNDKFDQRIVVFADGAALRSPHVPGIYDVDVTIAIQQSADTDEATTLFRTLCEEVRSLLELKADLPTMLSDLHGVRVHSLIVMNQSANPSDRGFQAIFNVQLFAELPH